MGAEGVVPVSVRATPEYVISKGFQRLIHGSPLSLKDNTKGSQIMSFHNCNEILSPSQEGDDESESVAKSKGIRWDSTGASLEAPWNSMGTTFVTASYGLPKAR